MMRVLKYIIVFTYILFISVLGMSLNKKISDEETYALKQNYSFLYKENENMNIIMYSNIKNPRFSYDMRNKYYLSDFSEDFYIAVDVLSITTEKMGNGYLFDLEIKIPNFSEIYIPDLYLNASNDYSYDRYNIGSLSVITDIYEDDGLRTSIAKITDNDIFSGITIIVSEILTINEIIISNAFSYEYDIQNKTINIYISSLNYTSIIYLIIKTSKGIIKIDNYFINNLKISLKGNERYYSIMERRDY